ncbi:hypothetical protein D3C80_824300 [compost metagenome]
MGPGGAPGDQVLTRGGGGGDVALGAAFVQSCRQTVAAANLMEGQGLAPDLAKLIVDRDTPVQGAIVQIGAGDLGGQDDFGVAQAPDRRPCARLGRLKRPPIGAEQVQLPRGVEAELIGVERRPRRAGRARTRQGGDNGILAEAGMAGLGIGREAGGCGGACDAGLVAGLFDAQGGLPHIQIGSPRLADQSIQQRIAETPPPGGVRLAFRRGLREGGGNGDGRFAIIRPSDAGGQQGRQGQREATTAELQTHAPARRLRHSFALSASRRHSIQARRLRQP